MIYDFMDTGVLTNEPEEMYSSEAVSINGTYIEEEIEGYSTLYTSGRESLAKEISSVETSQLNGTYVKGSRFPARTITVGFQIIAEDAEDFRVKFNELNRLLNVEDAEIVFDDEPDKFFTGTPVMDAEIEPGKNAATGEYHIYCADPFKYSTQLFQAEPELDGNVYIDYAGNYPAHPILQANFYSEVPAAEEEDADAVYEYYLSDDDESPVGGIWDEQYESPEEGQYVFRRKHIYHENGTESFEPSEDGELMPDEEEVPDPGETTDGDEDEVLGSLADCGYVAWFDENENIIQCGSVNEPDTETYPESQVLANNSFKNSGNWGQAQQALWPINSGVVPAGWVKQGTVAEAVASYYSNSSKTSGVLLDSAVTSSKIAVKEAYYKTAKDKKKKKKSYRYVDYNCVKVTSIKAIAKERTASTVKLAITLELTTLCPIQKKSRFTGSLKLGGTTETFRIKASGKEWAKGKVHSIKAELSFSGLTQTRNSISLSFSMSESGGSGGGHISERSMKTLPIPIYQPPNSDGYFLAPSNYGSPQSDKYTGPAITRQITASDKFSFSWKSRLSFGTGLNDNQQMGAQSVILSDSSNNIVAGIVFAKPKAGNSGEIQFYVNGTVKKKVSMDFGYKVKKQTGIKKTKKKGKTVNVKTYKTFNDCEKTCSIGYSDGKLSFSVVKASGAVTYYAKVAIAAVARITFGFMQYSNYPNLRWNGIYNVKFVKNACATFADIPNTFSAGDVLLVDTSDASIEINGERRMDVGAIGNDYETFTLEEGMNQIGFGYSDWFTGEKAGYDPTFVVKYREVFI